MKIIGVTFIFIVFAFWGFYRAYLYYSRSEEIKNCERLLDLILINLESKNLSVSDIIEEIKQCGNEAQKNIADRIQLKLYNNENISIDDIKETICRDDITNEILKDVLMFLGKCSVSEQVGKIKSAIKNISIRYTEALKEYKQKAKLSSSMGVLFGIFIIIILV